MRNKGLTKVLFLILGLALPSCASAQTAEDRSSNSDAQFVDWENLRRSGDPNDWLLAPGNGDFQGGDEIAPVFDVAPGSLAKAWMAVIASKPRTEIVAVSDDSLTIEAEQESAVFGFIDRISSRVSPLPENKSTISVYSRSTVGYWDLGVNKRRVRDWLADLSEQIVGEM